MDGPSIPVTPPSALPLGRQPSIPRLSARSRTVDFDVTDFTPRRRSIGCESDSVLPSSDTEADDSTAQAMRTAASNTLPHATSRPSGTTRAPSPRAPPLPSVPVPAEARAQARVLGQFQPRAHAQARHQQRQRHRHKQRKRKTLSWLPSNSTLFLLPPHPPTDLDSPRTIPPLRHGGVPLPNRFSARSLLWCIA